MYLDNTSMVIPFKGTEIVFRIDNHLQIKVEPSLWTRDTSCYSYIYKSVKCSSDAQEVRTEALR